MLFYVPQDNLKREEMRKMCEGEGEEGRCVSEGEEGRCVRVKEKRGDV